jgi:hypothetical protein
MRIRDFLRISYLYLFFFCVVAMLCAIIVIPVNSQTHPAASRLPEAGFTSLAYAAPMRAGEKAPLSQDISPPIPGPLPAQQQNSEPDINWAWLAVPALLGMLVITLNLRGGKAR